MNHGRRTLDGVRISDRGTSTGSFFGAFGPVALRAFVFEVRLEEPPFGGEYAVVRDCAAVG